MRSRLLPRGLLVGGLLLLLSPLGTPLGTAAASCASPSLDLERNQVLGRSFEVTGSVFVDGCHDALDCGSGCGAHCTDPEPAPQPLTDVPLELRQGGRTWVLAEADAGSTGRIAFSVTLPPGARPGPAVLRTPQSERSPVVLAPG